MTKSYYEYSYFTLKL